MRVVVRRHARPPGGWSHVRPDAIMPQPIIPLRLSSQSLTGFMNCGESAINSAVNLDILPLQKRQQKWQLINYFSIIITLTCTQNIRRSRQDILQYTEISGNNMASMRLLVAGAAGFSFFYVMKEKSRLYAISYGRHVYEGDEKRTTWDSNWDHRQPLKKEEKIGKDSGKNDEKGDNGDKNEISTATRHLILVRHGQYVMDKDPEKKVGGAKKWM